MSIIDAINQNTNSVVNGKLNLAQAIANKGGTLSDYTLVPSFSNLVDGVNSINGTAVNGATTTKIHATDYIRQGDVLELKRALGGFSFTGKGYGIPSSMPYGTSATYSLITSIPPKILSEDVIAVYVDPSNSSSSQTVILLLVDGEYKQLTVDGSYRGFSLSATDLTTSAIQGIHHRNAFAFDSVNDLLYTKGGSYVYVYKLDRTTLNLTTVVDKFTVDASGRPAADLYVHNNNMFITFIQDGGSNSYAYQYYFNPATNKLVSQGYVYRGVGFTPDGSPHTRAPFDFTYDEDDNLYVYLPLYQGGVAKPCIHKMVLGSDGIYVPDKTLILTDVRDEVIRLTSYVDAEFTVGQPSLNMSRGCKYAVYIDSSGRFHHINIDTNMMTITGELDVLFDDGLYPSSVESIKLVKDIDLLFLISNSDDYSTDEKLRLYVYDGSYNFVCCPSLDFEPAAFVLTLPVTFPYVLFSNTIVMDKLSGYVDTYEVTREEADYNYTGEPCNNMLTDAKVYGLATEDIDIGETKEGLIILS